MSKELQNKLLQYAPKPSQKVWDEISDALDNGTSFSDRLYQFKELPPTTIWTRISDQLNQVSGAKVIPFFQRYRTPIRYSAAAAIIGIIAVTTTLLIGKKLESEPVSQIPSTFTQTNKADNKSAVPSGQKNNSSLTANEASIDNDQKTFSSKVQTLFNRIKREENVSTAFLSKNFIPKKAESKSITGNNISADNYMVYSDGDGNAVKVPKKLFDYFACVKVDISCKERIELLQQKLASSTLSTDFNGLVELVRNLKENQ